MAYSDWLFLLSYSKGMQSTCIGSGSDDPDNPGHQGHFFARLSESHLQRMIRMWLGWSDELEIWLLVEARICNWICVKEQHGWTWHLSLHLLGFIEPCDTISPHTVIKCVVSGEWIFEVNKKSKDSNALDQFHLVCYPLNVATWCCLL